jgi:HAD superfamily hydrolase (TIGR01459 family)
MSTHTTVDALIARYDGFLIDAYGVLVSGAGPLPGAAAFLHRLSDAGRPWLIVTNDASKGPDIAAANYQAWALPIEADRIISSGSLLPGWLASQGLAGATTCLLGPESAHAFAGDNPLVPPQDRSWSVLAICDEDGFDFLPGMDAALSTAIARIDAGLPVHIVTPNPDLIYNAGPQRYGYAAGTMANMLVAALRLRFGSHTPEVAWLGKPNQPIFEAALARLSVNNPIMLGDQLATDVLGARRAGIDAVLVGTGVATWIEVDLPADEAPTWLIHGFGAAALSTL